MIFFVCRKRHGSDMVATMQRHSCDIGCDSGGGRRSEMAVEPCFEAGTYDLSSAFYERSTRL